MSFVLGRDGDREDGPVGRLGSYRALDGSDGAALHLDLNGPHAMLLVGKRGYGKSYTMGVIAEDLARSRGVAPVLVDPMGAFDTLAEPADGDAVPASVVEEPAVTAGSLDPRSWCELLGLSPERDAGSLLWRAAQEESTIDGMQAHVASAGASSVATRAAINHLRLADSWGVFDPDGLDATALGGPEVTVVDVSGLADAPMNAVSRGVAEALYRARIRDSIDRLPWLLLDEAHTFFDGVAEPALETILTRGRAPGVSLVAATQRPSAIPEVGISQSDILCAHRLTARDDLAALEGAQPTYMNGSLVDAERLPDVPGEVVIIDDETETIHAARIRSRDTPHGGTSPTASDVMDDGVTQVE
ncbi:DUF87 domain-containing protein [Natrinema zhouii]|uniref:ATP-binding protein n=1 Tax=Natrinema zhouii TaxID=1710539 RepID=A0A7D6GX30_9EURY|nr:DUF87 domain-containing protein [Natrinema zhouii]QLK26906.1 DUF87 domain-containing protein [Natrinema zhouii]